MDKLTAQSFMDAGAVFWCCTPMGSTVSELHQQGYDWDEIFEAQSQFSYSSWGDIGPQIRMKPKHDPRSVYCPTCDDPEIVMQPIGNGFKCPNCGRLDLSPDEVG